MKSILSIFSESANSFTGQEAGEKVILLLRRHPFYIILKLLLFAAFIFIPIFLGLIFSPFLVANGLFALALFLISIWCLILWQVFFYSLTMYSLDVWIITDRRIIDSTQNGFFNRTISELHITRIQDISVHIDGPVQTFFRFGDLQIQTAGTEEKFKFIQIPNPEEVKNEIMNLAHSKDFSGKI